MLLLLVIPPETSVAQDNPVLIALDPWLSFTELEAAAEAGDAVAQYRIGGLYLETGSILGSSKEERFEDAHDWLTRSASQGYDPGQAALAALLLNPGWQQSDPTRGEQILTDLASKGSMSAMAHLGQADMLRWTSMRRDRWGIDLIIDAAEAGHPQAAAQLAGAYANGGGVAQDDGLAVHWYREAAERGDPPGQYIYAMLFATGRFGTKIDPDAQMNWLFRAAIGGSTTAQREFARILNDPAHPHYDPALAQGWLQIATENGDGRAEQMLFQLGLPGRGGAMPLIPEPGETRRMSAESIVVTTGLVLLGLTLLAPNVEGGGGAYPDYVPPHIPCSFGTIDVGGGVCADLPDF